MPKVAYRYREMDVPPNEPYPEGHSIYRPYVYATIIGSNGRWTRCIVMLDSGADSCLFPLDVALDLKLNPRTFPKAMTSGVGSTANETYYDYVTIDLDFGIVFEAYVGFTPALNLRTTGLLGQSGFFSNFDVCFSLAQGVFTVESRTSATTV